MARHRDNRTALTPNGYEGKHQKKDSEKGGYPVGDPARRKRLGENPDGWFVER